MADILTKLSNKYDCDKSDKNHKYTIRYHKRFKEKRNQDFSMLEFGFGKGKSVKMWLDYFTRAKLFTVDIMKELPNDKLIKKHIKSGRFEFISADQIDIKKLLKIFKKQRRFYLIIDDASHVPEDQQFTFGNLFPLVANCGYYVIEDLKCKRSHSKRFDWQGEKTLNVLNNYIKTGIFESKILSEIQNSYLTRNILEIEIFDKIAFIKKREINGY